MNDRGNPASPRQKRAERLSAALRANLKRRKAQARGRNDRPESGNAGGSRPVQPPTDHNDG